MYVNIFMKKLILKQTPKLVYNKQIDVDDLFIIIYLLIEVYVR